MPFEEYKLSSTKVTKINARTTNICVNKKINTRKLIIILRPLYIYNK